MATLNWVAGDVGRSLAVTLYRDDVAVDLTGASITCKMVEREAGTVTSITGLSGDDSGVVVAAFAADDLVEGVYDLEFLVVGGLTYPGEASGRIVLNVRALES